MSLVVIFSHGKESGPSGVKISALMSVCDEQRIDSISIDYRGIEDPEIRANKLRDAIKGIDTPVILVGSSMGSYVSLRACNSEQVTGLFLMAPAVFMPGYDNTDISPGDRQTLVIHGWQDDIVPVDNALRFASEYGTELLVLNDDHVLRHSLERLCIEFRRFLASFLTTGSPD